jgi:hypothetical protein
LDADKEKNRCENNTFHDNSNYHFDFGDPKYIEKSYEDYRGRKEQASPKT